MDMRALLMGLAFAVMWASAFTAARIIVTEAPPLLALALRFSLSGVVGVAIALLAGQSWRLSRAQWGGVIIFGFMQNAVYLGLNFTAMQWVGASVAAIIGSAMPLLVAVAGWLFMQDRLRPLAVMGLLGGFGGVLMIMLARLQGGVDPVGLVLCLIAVLALTIATLAARRLGSTSSDNILMVVGIQMLVGAVAVGIPGLATETWDVTWSWRLAGAFLFASLLSGLLATWVWFRLVARVGAVKASVFHFLNPFVGVLVAWALLDEGMGMWDVIGVIVIAGGILAVQLSRESAPRAA